MPWVPIEINAKSNTGKNHRQSLAWRSLVAGGYIFICLLSDSGGAQWLSGRVLDSRPKGRGFEPHRRHCVVVLEQAFILA